MNSQQIKTCNKTVSSPAKIHTAYFQDRCLERYHLLHKPAQWSFINICLFSMVTCKPTKKMQRLQCKKISILSSYYST